MHQKSRRVRERTRERNTSYFKGVFVDATITGRNNQDSDSAAASGNDRVTTMGLIVDDCVRIV